METEGSNADPEMNSLAKIMALVAAAGVVAFCALHDGKSADPDVRREATCSQRGERDAANIAPQFVTDRLKAPATADFPRDLQKATYIGGCNFAVVGKVDAQNGFGAQIRSTYAGEIEYLPGEDKWQLKSMVID